jgi:hypothetical protein
MDLLDLAILALRLVLVALLYVFLATVLRLTTRGLRAAPPPSPASAPLPASPAPGNDARASRLQLVVLEPGGSSLNPGQVLAVADGAVLGRAEAAQVRLVDVAVSGQHARLSRVGQAWVVTDLGSTNGTHVNDVAVQRETPLREGDVLALGNVRLKVGAHSG